MTGGRSGRNWRGFVRAAARRWIAGWYELLMLLPVWLPLWHYGLGGLQVGGWLPLLPLFTFAGGAIALFARVLWIAGAAALLLSGGLFAALGFRPDGALGFAFGLAGMLMGATADRRSRSIPWYWAGVGLYAAGSIAFPYDARLAAHGRLLAAAGTVCLAVALLATNRAHLRYVAMADGDAPAVPSMLRRHNRIFVAALLAAALVLAAGLGSWIGRVLHDAVAGAFRLLAALLDRAPAPPPEPSAPAAPPPMPLPPQGEPSRFSRIMDIALYALGWTILAAGAAWLAYRLYLSGGLLRRWIGRLIALLAGSGRSPASDGYTDEEEVVFRWEEVRQRWRDSRIGRLRFGRREPGWNELADNRERVRYLYRRWLRGHTARGYEAKRHLTPLETERDVARWEAAASGRGGRSQAALGGGAPEEASPSPLIRLYYKARYGEKPVSDEELARLGGEHAFRPNGRGRPS